VSLTSVNASAAGHSVKFTSTRSPGHHHQHCFRRLTREAGSANVSTMQPSPSIEDQRQFLANVRAIWQGLAEAGAAREFGNAEGGSVEQQRDRRLQLHHCANYAALLTLLQASERELRLLELGCGSGALSHALARAMPEDWTMTATDYSTGLIEQAGSSYARANLTFRNMDVLNLDRRRVAEADAIFFLEVIEHLPQDTATRMLTGICEAMSPGARLILTTLDRSPFPRAFSGYAPHFVEYTWSSLRTFLESATDPAYLSVRVFRLVSERIAHEAVRAEANGGYVVNRLQRLLVGLTQPFPLATSLMVRVTGAAYRAYSLLPQKADFDLDGYLAGLAFAREGLESHDAASFGLVAVLTKTGRPDDVTSARG
jgi:2-polyprenyl-3-methyl-5-hydroxy-6-metoxy-1,4-benzoquinol methylase